MRVLPWAAESAPYFAALVASSCSTRLNGTTEDGATLKGLPATSIASAAPANGATMRCTSSPRSAASSCDSRSCGGKRQHPAFEGLHEFVGDLPALRRLCGDR